MGDMIRVSGASRNTLKGHSSSPSNLKVTRQLPLPVIAKRPNGLPCYDCNPHPGTFMSPAFLASSSRVNWRNKRAA